MLSAAPSGIGPSGYSAVSLAPAQYNGVGGPGTFEIVTLSAGRMVSAIVTRLVRRPPNAAREGDITSAHSVIDVAPTAFSRSFRSRVAAVMAWRRSVGSARSVASGAIIA